MEEGTITTPIQKRRRVINIVKRSNLENAIRSLMLPPCPTPVISSTASKANPIEISEDGTLFLKVLVKPKSFSLSGETISTANIGFVTLPSRRTSTFYDARQCINSDLYDDDDDDDDITETKTLRQNPKWKFYVPGLGPMSYKQERKLGPMLEFLQSTTDDVKLGDGTGFHPLKVVIIEVGNSNGTNDGGDEKGGNKVGVGEKKSVGTATSSSSSSSAVVDEDDGVLAGTESKG